MNLTKRWSNSNGCPDGTCPAVYDTDTGDQVIQGARVPEQPESVDLPANTPTTIIDSIPAPAITAIEGGGWRVTGQPLDNGTTAQLTDIAATETGVLVSLG